MRISKRSLEGYLMVDHRDSPGLTPEFLRQVQAAFPYESTLPSNSGHGLFEAPMLRCSHCQAGIILNPSRNLVLRPREYCPGCDRYICDKCTVLKKIGVGCKPIERVIEEVLAKAAREQSIKEL